MGEDIPTKLGTKKANLYRLAFSSVLAPQPGLEPGTYGLTVVRISNKKFLELRKNQIKSTTYSFSIRKQLSVSVT